MSSTLLYLAIVAVWACVLVPMWLRRDTDANAFSRLLNRRPGSDAEHEHEHEYLADTADIGDAAERNTEFLDEEQVPHRRRVRRATVIARRRRRTFLLAVAMLAAGTAAAARLGPWWVALPPVGLMIGHLALLRVAAHMDADRRYELRQARARAEERLAEEARLADEAARAEIIDLAERARARDVFDQYADGVPRPDGAARPDGVARAVGD